MLNFWIDTCQKEQNRLLDQIRLHDREIARLQKLDFIDENQSVKWNRDEIKRRIHSEKVKKGLLEKKLSCAMDPVVDYIKEELKNDHTSLPKDVIELAYDWGVKESCGGGYADIHSRANDFAEFAERVLELTQN